MASTGLTMVMTEDDWSPLLARIEAAQAAAGGAEPAPSGLEALRFDAVIFGPASFWRFSNSLGYLASFLAEALADATDSTPAAAIASVLDARGIA